MTAPATRGIGVYVCLCNGVTDRQVREAVLGGARSLEEAARRTGAATACGGCRARVEDIMRTALGPDEPPVRDAAPRVRGERREAQPVVRQIQALERSWTALGRWLSSRRADAAVGLELTQPQFHALGFLAERGAVRMADLAGELSISDPAAARIVERLLRAALVSRTLDPADRRTIWVEATPNGRQTVAFSRRKRIEEFKRLLDPLDLHERAEFIRLSEKIASPLERGGPGAPRAAGP